MRIGKVRARHETEQLLRRLLGRTPPRDEGLMIEVTYPRRFPTGKGVIAVIIPLQHLTVGMVRRLCEANSKSHYPPVISSDRIRIIFRFPKIQSGDEEALREKAHVLARWSEGFVGTRAVVSSRGGLIGFLWQQRALFDYR